MRGRESGAGGRGRVGGDLRRLPPRRRIHWLELSVQNHHRGIAQVKNQMTIKWCLWEWDQWNSESSRPLKWWVVIYWSSQSITDGNLNVFFCFNTILVWRLWQNTVITVYQTLVLCFLCSMVLVLYRTLLTFFNEPIMVTCCRFFFYILIKKYFLKLIYKTVFWQRSAKHLSECCINKNAHLLILTIHLYS